MVATRDPIEPTSPCDACGYWYPKGAHGARMCPMCTTRFVDFMRCAPALFQLLARMVREDEDSWPTN